ncbi:hypothetical protein Hanom_Chr08g00729751 [Helianthus anomalus]
MFSDFSIKFVFKACLLACLIFKVKYGNPDAIIDARELLKISSLKAKTSQSLYWSSFK